MLEPTRCSSDLRFDALLGDELLGRERSELLAHLDACAVCHDRLAAIAYERSCFLASELAAPGWLTELQASRAGSSTPWRLFALIALGACALLAGLHAQRPKKQAGARDHVSVYAERAVRAGAATQAGPLRTGDVLRFAYTAERPRQLAILSIDASRRVRVYFPAGDSSRGVEAAAEALLPAAPREAASARGEERVFAVFCDVSFAIAPLRAALAAQGVLSALPKGCHADALTLRKEAPLDEARRGE